MKRDRSSSRRGSSSGARSPRSSSAKTTSFPSPSLSEAVKKDRREYQKELRVRRIIDPKLRAIALLRSMPDELIIEAEKYLLDLLNAKRKRK